MSGGLTYVSFGAGVQSTALVVMSALGLRGCPPANYAAFSDTGDEPSYVYKHLRDVQAWGAKHGMSVHVIKLEGSDTLSTDFLTGRRSLGVPAFVEGADGRAAPLHRQCTERYKIEPLQRFAKAQLGLGSRDKVGEGVKVRTLMGISIEEAHRMRAPRKPWIENVYPLIDVGMSRGACMDLIEAHGLKPPPDKSSCVFCPYHSDRYWRRLHEDFPDDFTKAADFDEAMRARGNADGKMLMTRKAPYLHRSLIPLRELPFASGQQRFGDGFGNECEGICGV